MAEKDQKDKQQSMSDATKDLVRLAGPCTNSKMKCNGFSVARTELTPAHAALIESIESTQQLKAKKGNSEAIVSPVGPHRSYLPHSELSIYKVCGICPTKMRFNTVWHGSCTLTSTARPTSTNRTAWTVHNKERYASVDLAVTHEWVAVVFCCTKIKFTGTICPPSQDSIKTIPDPAVI